MKRLTLTAAAVALSAAALTGCSGSVSFGASSNPDRASSGPSTQVDPKTGATTLIDPETGADWFLPEERPDTAAKLQFLTALQGNADQACDLLTDQGFAQAIQMAAMFGLVDKDATCPEYVAAISDQWEQTPGVDDMTITSAVKEESTDRATVLLTTTIEGTTTVNTLDMVAVDGAWKVNGVTNTSTK